MFYHAFGPFMAKTVLSTRNNSSILIGCRVEHDEWIRSAAAIGSRDLVCCYGVDRPLFNVGCVFLGGYSELRIDDCSEGVAEVNGRSNDAY